MGPLDDATLEIEDEDTAPREDTSKYLEQALKATDGDLRDAQKALSNMTAEEQAKMALSELDPITYYFACIKTQPPEECDPPFQSQSSRTVLEEKAERLQNPGMGEHTTEASKEAFLSKKLKDLRSRLTPEEELKILEESLKKDFRSESVKPSNHCHVKDGLQGEQRSWTEKFGPSRSPAGECSNPLTASTTASPQPEVSLHSPAVKLEYLLMLNRVTKLITAP